MAEYPDDWDRVELGSIGTWSSGGTPSTSVPQYWDGDMPWISAVSLKSFDIHHSDRRVTELGANSGTRRVPANTVIFVVRGMSLKSEFRVGITSREVTFGQDCKAIEVPDGINPRFLAYALKAKENEILSMVDEAGHGTGRLPTPQLAHLVVGVPDKSKQDHIVRILRRVEKLSWSTEYNTSKVGRIKLGIIDSLLSDSGAAGNYTDLDSCLLRIEAGSSPDLPDRPAGPGEWGVLKVSAVRPWGFDSAENKVMPQRALVNPKMEVHDGDLLITRANTPTLVGLACVVHNPPARLLLCDKTLRLILDPARLVGKFAEYVLGAPAVRRQIEASGTGSSGTMKNISQDQIRSLRFQRPDVDVQHHVVEQVEASTAVIWGYKAELAKLRNVKQGLMDDLLSGRVRAGDLAGVGVLGPPDGWCGGRGRLVAGVFSSPTLRF